MNVLVLRTNISTRHEVLRLKPSFDNHRSISRWTIDTEDIDKVLRVETEDNLSEHDVISMVESLGFFGEDLDEQSELSNVIVLEPGAVA